MTWLEEIAGFQLLVLLLKVGIVVGMMSEGDFGSVGVSFFSFEILSAILFSTVLIHFALISTFELSQLGDHRRISRELS